jgi:hypothetical protein
VQVEQRQHLRDLWGLPSPRRQNRRGEPLALPGGLINAFVVHARRLDLHRPGRGDNRPLGVEPVAHHQTTSVVVALVGKFSKVGVDLGLQRCGQHPPRAIPDDLIDQRAVRLLIVGIDYGKHGRALPADVGASAYSVAIESITREGTSPSRSTGSEHCSRSHQPFGHADQAKTRSWRPHQTIRSRIDESAYPQVNASILYSCGTPSAAERESAHQLRNSGKGSPNTGTSRVINALGKTKAGGLAAIEDRHLRQPQRAGR